MAGDQRLPQSAAKPGTVERPVRRVCFPARALYGQVAAGQTQSQLPICPPSTTPFSPLLCDWNASWRLLVTRLQILRGCTGAPTCPVVVARRTPPSCVCVSVPLIPYTQKSGVN